GARGQKRGAGVSLRVVEQQTPAMVAVALARRPAARVEGSGERVDHCADELPHVRSAGKACSLAFDRRCEKQLEHEDVVAARQLSIETASEGLPMRFTPERGGGAFAPRRCLREVRQGAGSRELAGGLGDEVIVRRGAVAWQPGEIFLMMMQ